MWNLRKKLFVSLLVLFLFSGLAMGQATSSTKSTTQEVQIDLNTFLEQDMSLQQNFTKNLNEDSLNSTASQNSSTDFQMESMNAATLLYNQDMLLNSLEEQWKNLELQVQALEIQSSSLKKDNEKLENMLESSKSTIANLKTNLKNYKEALVSNKDDTAAIIALFADAQQEIDTLKTYVAKLERDVRKLKNTRITAGISAIAGIGVFILANTVPTEQRMKDFLNGIGGGLVTAGGVTLGVSFIF